MTNYFENKDGSVDADGTLYNKIISMGSLNYMDLIKILPKHPEIDKLLMSMPHMLHNEMNNRSKVVVSEYKNKYNKVFNKIQFGNVRMLFTVTDGGEKVLYNIHVIPWDME